MHMTDFHQPETISNQIASSLRLSCSLIYD